MFKHFQQATEVKHCILRCCTQCHTQCTSVHGRQESV